MESLFGAEMPLAVRFFLAFLIVLGLIGAIAWALRRFGAGRFRDTARGRQPRLAVIDHASVDGRRRLILVRRDNVEHLLMIGGPTDIVVEPNIVRAMAAPGARPPAGIEALPRAIPLPENGGSWPLQPEPTTALRPTPRLEPLPDELPQRSELPRTPQPVEPPRPQRETLAALADELGTRPAPPRRSTFARPEPRAEAKNEIRAEPQLDMPAEPPQAAPAIVPPPAPPPAAAAEADQSLADMASRLEAALRKPGGSQPAEPPAPRRPAAPPRSSAPQADAAIPADTLPPLPSRTPRPPAEPKRAEPKPGQNANQASNQGNKTALYDSLEQEMASLLGRPNKT
jgi:flagellar protein FliO/FliZ